MIPKPNVIRNIRTLRLFISRSVGDKKISMEEKVAAMSPEELVKNTVKVSDWNKMLLVFSGRFKTMKDIPERLPYGTVDKERNKVRIKLANYMMIATVIGCLCMIISGKRAAEAGDTVTKRQLDLHAEYEKEKREKDAAAAAAKTA